MAAVFFFFSMAAAGAAEQAPQEGITIRLVDIPEAAQSDSRARSYIVDNVPPGTAIGRRIEVQNNTTEPQSIELYATAAEVKANAFTGLAKGERNELTGWIAMEKPTVDLAAGESAEVMVHIEVPPDAPEGEQYAALWAEVRSAPAAGTQFITASRVGIRVYLSVGPGNGPPAAFTIADLAAGHSNGAPQVTADVTNTGGRALDIQGELALTDGPGGLSAGSVSLDGTVTIAPGETAPVTVSLAPELPSGAWHAQLDLKSGLVTEQAAADLTFSGGEAPVEEPDHRIIMIPAVVAVLLLVGAALWLVRRRKTAAANQPE
ncbi:DUF916 domain-containing protein [Arthrobacter jiangjiafuii]|uniref:DUF916 domain-containing protein n=1 Tax=Arthrobacter jiangjiafuii TaxID=2817475 RepID=A0A975R2E0_9MICC|nr:hypothetical protein [Arthrobacter jiangjiafuii]QWC11493.1 DUF916 domain-containing protein [Arthrobacter jiangjiafuii]